ncbi:allatostatin-A receptor-like [Diadema antillarum]|uniref:allatostatin-A receptor-like n=1 Tax=Diadema antillarum TaxID=105358 RepID=UPI003A88D5F6
MALSVFTRLTSIRLVGLILLSYLEKGGSSPIFSSTSATDKKTESTLWKTIHSDAYYDVTKFEEEVATQVTAGDFGSRDGWTSPTEVISSSSRVVFHDSVDPSSDGFGSYISPSVQTSSGWSWKATVWSWWLILQMFTATLGIVGNSLVIIVLFTRRELSRSTDTLIGALAAADLLASVFMIPLPLPVTVPSSVLGQLYCKVVYTSMFLWVSFDASIFTLTAIAVERYIAVAYPFHFKHLVTRKRVIIVIVANWILGFMVTSFLFNVAKVDKTSNNCASVFPSKDVQMLIGTILFLMLFVIPALLSLTMQAMTAHALHRQSLVFRKEGNQEGLSNPSARHLAARKRVLQMLFIVVLVFIVCWAPSQCVYFVFNLGLLPDSYWYSPLNNALVVLSFGNSCANPIIYTVRYPEFRTAIGELFSAKKGKSTTPLFSERTEGKPVKSVESVDA